MANVHTHIFVRELADLLGHTSHHEISEKSYETPSSKLRKQH